MCLKIKKNRHIIKKQRDNLIDLVDYFFLDQRKISYRFINKKYMNVLSALKFVDNYFG